MPASMTTERRAASELQARLRGGEFVVTGYGEVYRVPLFGADAIIRGVWLFP